MDVASGVVGFLSFSITVCNGLVEYYQSWSSRDEAVNGLIQSLQNLQHTLDLLRKPIANLSDEQVGDEAIKHLNVLEYSLRTKAQHLQEVLQRCRTDKPPADIWEHIKIIRTKALYPFKKNTIQELSRTINDLQGTLALTTNALQLCVRSRMRWGRHSPRCATETQRSSCLTIRMSCPKH